jgi:hypothetical protein
MSIPLSYHGIDGAYLQKHKYPCRGKTSTELSMALASSACSTLVDPKSLDPKKIDKMRDKWKPANNGVFPKPSACK